MGLPRLKSSQLLVLPRYYSRLARLLARFGSSDKIGPFEGKMRAIWSKNLKVPRQVFFVRQLCICMSPQNEKSENFFGPGKSQRGAYRGGSRTLSSHGRTLRPSASGRVAQAARRHRHPSEDTHGRCVSAGGQCVRRRRVALLGRRVGASARRSRGVGAGLHGFVRVLARTTPILTIILIIILIITLIITPMIILIMIPTGWMPPIGSLILEIQGGTH